MAGERISTGVAGLDEIMLGGFLPSSSYLIVGAPGTGKTILAIQWLRECARHQAKCLFVSFSEPIESVQRNIRAFGWDLGCITFADFTKQTPGSGEDEEYAVFPPSEVEQEPVWQQLRQVIDQHDPDRVVIDSATYLRYLSIDEYQYRKRMQRLVNQLSERGCVSLLLYEPMELARETSVALAVDGVICLKKEISPNRVIEVRTVEISKLRASSFLSGRHAMRITAEGVVVYPHRIERPPEHACEKEILPSGIASLDHLLKGGLPGGSCTLISGPSGAGKSTLAAQYLVTAAANGMRSAIYTFEESIHSILERNSDIGIPLQAWLESGTISIHEINPLEMYPDEFLGIIRHDIEKENRRLILLDSLRGYALAMEEFGKLVANIQNLVHYACPRGASLLLINELEQLTGDLRISEVGVSYLADNVILLRYAEYNGEVIKVINCLKKRHGDFLPELREFRITPRGIVVGEKLQHLRGILTGIPWA